MSKHVKITLIIVSVLLITAIAALAVLNHYNLLPRRSYTAADFEIELLRSPMDFNQNGIDDYTDFLLGARKDAENRPTYDGRYWDHAYPPENIGVCTDTVWRAFKAAGYDLRHMVDADIHARRDAYPAIETPDNHIDFRRVGNLHVFFKAHAQTLTNDSADIAAWQPGDIVIFGDDVHIGIVSDKRNRNGVPYIIHNGGQPNREEDYLKRGAKVTGHYRFDASQLPAGLLIAWEG